MRESLFQTHQTRRRPYFRELGTGGVSVHDTAYRFMRIQVRTGVSWEVAIGSGRQGLDVWALDEVHRGIAIAVSGLPEDSNLRLVQFVASRDITGRSWSGTAPSPADDAAYEATFSRSEATLRGLENACAEYGGVRIDGARGAGIVMALSVPTAGGDGVVGYDAPTPGVGLMDVLQAHPELLMATARTTYHTYAYTGSQGTPTSAPRARITWTVVTRAVRVGSVFVMEAPRITDVRVEVAESGREISLSANEQLAMEHQLADSWGMENMLGPPTDD